MHRCILYVFCSLASYHACSAKSLLRVLMQLHVYSRIMIFSLQISSVRELLLRGSGRRSTTTRVVFTTHSRPRAGCWMSPVYLHTCRSMPSSSDAETCWRLWRDKNTLEGKLRI